MKNKTMSTGLKKVIDETSKQIEPLLKLSQNQGKNNYITYYDILTEYQDENMRKFVALVLMNCKGVDKIGVIEAMKIFKWVEDLEKGQGIYCPQY